jgi:hypothetical protein
MTFIDPAPLERAIGHMVEQMNAYPADVDEMPLEACEKLAKAISVHVKAVQDITAHNARCAAQEDDKKYLSYENLPPPSPEERARFIKRLTHLYNRLNAGREIPSPDTGTS